MSNEKGNGGKSIAIPLYGFDYVHAPYDNNISDLVYLLGSSPFPRTVESRAISVC